MKLPTIKEKGPLLSTDILMPGLDFTPYFIAYKPNLNFFLLFFIYQLEHCNLFKLHSDESGTHSSIESLINCKISELTLNIIV